MFQHIRTIIVSLGLLMAAAAAQAQVDPGVRGGAAGAGAAIAGLTNHQSAFFQDGENRFTTVEGVAQGLGPRFNLTSCSGCHAFPAIGGTSPFSNPEVSVAPANQVNPLITLGIISANGPVREVRFRSNGGVHDLFTIMGRSDTPAGCNISQPDFATHIAAGDVIFRIPTPTFGTGLIEAIPDATIAAHEAASKPFGITGHANRNGNDGTITRFGWKAQNKSLLIFSGEAYNVEMGVSNEAFPDERGEAGVQDPVACQQPFPNDATNFTLTQPQKVSSDVVGFALFMKMLDQPTPVSSFGTVTAASINNGRTQFTNVGCSVCHTPSVTTGNHSIAALAFQTANLFSDLLVHNMGALGDGISQGNAGPNEFRSAPLWGIGQRIFFLHDGRTTDLLAAIQAHSSTGSEANTVIANFNALSVANQQDVLNFLRSL